MMTDTEIVKVFNHIGYRNLHNDTHPEGKKLQPSAAVFGAHVNADSLGQMIDNFVIIE